MPRIHYACALLLALLSTRTLSAQQLPTHPTPLAALPQEFSFPGSYDCEGSFRNAKVHKASFTAAIVVGGKWLELTEQDLQPTTGYLAKYLIGYDAGQKRLVEFDANNFSASVYSSDEGWKNKQLTMTSAIDTDITAPYAVNRFVYALTGPDTFTVDWQISKTATLNWVLSDHLACKRHL